ncbi:hypothetical protein G6F31_015071 [Rhizopus arrhizus]|nr:hypothetical protein G6F31_015071 [Rhizopus arrhizus]
MLLCAARAKADIQRQRQARMLRYSSKTKERRMSLDLRVIAAALGALFCSSAQAAAPAVIDLPTAQAQAQLLDMLEKESLYRDRVDWPAIRGHRPRVRQIGSAHV